MKLFTGFNLIYLLDDDTPDPDLSQIEMNEIPFSLSVIGQLNQIWWSHWFKTKTHSIQFLISLQWQIPGAGSDQQRTSD